MFCIRLEEKDVGQLKMLAHRLTAKNGLRKPSQILRLHLEYASSQVI